MPVSEVSSWADPFLLSQGVSHGVTFRGQGSMKEPENRRRALAAAGLPEEHYVLKQVHGTTIHRIEPGRPVAPAPEGDGWITDESGAVATVYVADCTPLFLWDRSGRAAGVFHSGWRGTAAGMPRRAVESLRESFGIEPSRLYACVGPRVGVCCYRVGPEVARRFARSMRGEHLDLGAETKAQLVEAGVEESRITVPDRCTACSGLFFSYRREKQDSRMMAFIAVPKHG